MDLLIYTFDLCKAKVVLFYFPEALFQELIQYYKDDHSYHYVFDR